jgi:hypothetical protein
MRIGMSRGYRQYRANCYSGNYGFRHDRRGAKLGAKPVMMLRLELGVYNWLQTVRTLGPVIRLSAAKTEDRLPAARHH